MHSVYTFRQFNLRINPIVGLACWATMTFCPGPLVAAERHLSKMTYSEKKKLAPAVWHQHASDKSIPWEIDIIEVDIASPEIEVVSIDAINESRREKVIDLAKRSRAIAAINAGFFNMKTGASSSHFELDDVMHAVNHPDAPPRSTMGLTDGESQSAVMSILDSKGKPLFNEDGWKHVAHAIGGGPGLIRDGKHTVMNNFEGFGKEDFVEKRHPRTAVGFNSRTKRMFWVTVDGRQPGWSEGMSLIELTQLMSDLGCDNAMNFDGGGSSTCVVNGKVINRVSGKERSERAVSNAWVVRRSLPTITIDNDDQGVTQIGDWQTSTKDGCYEEDMLICQIAPGSGERGRVSWKANIPKSGEYLIEAWWVADNDRANGAEYSVNMGGASTSIMVNQRKYGSRWNSLGTFTVQDGQTPKIELTANGIESATLAADAIRFTRLGPAEE